MGWHPIKEGNEERFVERLAVHLTEGEIEGVRRRVVTLDTMIRWMANGTKPRLMHDLFGASSDLGSCFYEDMHTSAKDMFLRSITQAQRESLNV